MASGGASRVRPSTNRRRSKLPLAAVRTLARNFATISVCPPAGRQHELFDLNMLVALDALLAKRNVTKVGERLHPSQPSVRRERFSEGTMHIVSIIGAVAVSL